MVLVAISFHLLHSINPSLGTDTTGCGTCQNSIYSTTEHNRFTLHININTHNDKWIRLIFVSLVIIY